MELKTLESIPLATILETFNYAFSDYLVKLQLSKQQLMNKMESEGIELNYSVGMFDGDNMVGFILHAPGNWLGKPTVYNAGTGVIPTYRGKAITQKMYQYIIPKLKEKGINQHLLEYVEGNTFAKRIYEQVGFKPNRELDCLKGKINTKVSADDNCLFKEIEQPEWECLSSKFSVQPSWQNSINSIKRAGSKRKTIGLFHANELMGFTSFNPENGRIGLFFINEEERNKGYGTLLLAYLQNNFDGELSVFNLDKSNQAVYVFFTKRGLKSVAPQVEMLMDV
ncbi:GNAT family N-acetyltransferase [Solitalea sp. MAHUQ-68]|uniref:GNAT family N-acetyltransferase n=1 Tax=Solitalea agri TaxID=2953739 RepID=A0A9X2F832_9SPHI|nr:GNAT family N-acetyltransferase [Solitalea agri]MCO4293478.1 GNAT family N-acetyltransferase [Solitalea agri]